MGENRFFSTIKILLKNLLFVCQAGIKNNILKKKHGVKKQKISVKKFDVKIRVKNVDPRQTLTSKYWCTKFQNLETIFWKKNGVKKFGVKIRVKNVDPKKIRVKNEKIGVKN